MRRGFAPALVALACLAMTAATAQAAPGDIAVTDSGSWFGDDGRVVKVTPDGAATELAAGGPIRDPSAVAVRSDGWLLVADEASEAVYSIAPSGTVRTLVHGAGLMDPAGIALAPGGMAYLTDRARGAVLRLDLATGALAVVARIGGAAGLAMDKAGKLLVTDGHVLRRVDPGTGAIAMVATGAPLDEPRDVAVGQDGTLYLAGDRQVVRVNPVTGAKSLLATGAPLNDPRGIDVDPEGNLLVADRHSAGGAVIRVDRETGAKSMLGHGPLLRRPTGLASVGGAGVDASGGGNGDPLGPAAPPPPPPPAGDGPGGSDGPGGTGGTPAAGIPGPGGTTIQTHPDGTTTVTLPDGRVVTLPAGVTPGTSGILGVDFVAPSFLAKPRVRPSVFRAARRGRAFVATAIGTRIAYKLSEPARVTISVQKFRPLSRICKRKLARQSRHRTGTRCRKYISLKGRFAKASRAGASSVRFRGRLKGKTLQPGRYRFVIRARDGAGNVTKPRRPVFRIVR